MSIIRAVAAAAVLAAVLVSLAAVGWASSLGRPGRLILTGSGSAGEPSQQAANATAPGSFHISGGVAGLYPGVQVPLVLTITNPQRFTIVVTSLSAAVGAAGTGCMASDLTVTSFSGQLLVAAGGRAQASLQVTLSHSAPDACQGAVFPLQYSGAARKAG